MLSAPSAVNPSSIFFVALREICFSLHLGRTPMFFRALTTASALVFAAASSFAADTKMTVKVEKTDPPKELADAVRKTLNDQAMSVFDENGKLMCTVWATKSLDTKATADQAKAGLKYSQVEET